jgi:hypothetical protein
LLELAESNVNTVIPGLSMDHRGERNGGESQSSCIVYAKTFKTRWSKGPVSMRDT